MRGSSSSSPAAGMQRYNHLEASGKQVSIHGGNTSQTHLPGLQAIGKWLDTSSRNKTSRWTAGFESTLLWSAARSLTP